jgi:hypothetical protein
MGRVKARKTEMVGISHQRDGDTSIPGLCDDSICGNPRNILPDAIAPINAQDCAVRLNDRLGKGVDTAHGDPSQVRSQATQAMSVHAAKMCLHDMARESRSRWLAHLRGARAGDDHSMQVPARHEDVFSAFNHLHFSLWLTTSGIFVVLKPT